MINAFRAFSPVFLLGLYLLGPMSSEACQCGLSKTLEEEISASTVVFVGVVTKIEGINTHFKVEKVVKGDKFSTISLRPESATDCDFNFSEGGVYMVFAYGSLDHLRTSKCTATNQTKLFESIPEEKTTKPTISIGIGVAIGLLGLFLFSGLLFRKKAPPKS